MFGETSREMDFLQSESALGATRQGKNFAILYDFPNQPLEITWRNCLANGDMPTHFAAPEYFREPRLPEVTRFAVLALDPQSPALRAIGSLTGVVNRGSVTSGQIGTPQICIDKSVDPQLAATLLADGLMAVCASAKLLTVFSWFSIDAFRKMRFRETLTTGTAALDLSAGPEKTFSRLKGRSQIRHAISAGVQVRQATPEDLPEYYAILKDWSAQKGLPCPSFEVQQESFRLTNNRRLFLAVHEGKIIAGTPVRFYPGATAEYAWNASLPEFQHLRPNDLIHWRIIEWACQQGIHTYLLGATHTFLLKYSDRVIPTYRYVADRTFFRTHTLKENLAHTAVRAYRSLPPGLKNTLKRLRG